jgi:hypothetical protein
MTSFPVELSPRYAGRCRLHHPTKAQVDKGPGDRADTCRVRSDEADRVDPTPVWSDDALTSGDEPDDDGLDGLREDARAAAKTGAVWFAEEFQRREAEEIRSPTFPPLETPAPVDAAVEAHAIDTTD